jgi:hypothetical protein
MKRETKCGVYILMEFYPAFRIEGNSDIGYNTDKLPGHYGN